jgi:hypothetical protein
VDSVWRRRHCLDALHGNWKTQKQGQEEQELGAYSNQGMLMRPSREKPHPEPLRGLCRRIVLLWKWPDLRKTLGLL